MEPDKGASQHECRPATSDRVTFAAQATPRPADGLISKPLLETWGAGRASRLLYLQTIFVALLACLLLGESLHEYDLTGATFIVVGLVLAAAIKPKASRRA